MNGEYQDDSPLGILMHDFYCTDPDDMRFKELADRARHFKRSEEGVKSMCRMLEGMREEVAEKTAKETAKKSAQEFAYKSVNEGKFTVEEAIAFYGLTDNDVKEIFQTAI